MIFNQFLKFIKNREVTLAFIYLLLMLVIPGTGLLVMGHLIYIALKKGNEWYFKSLVYFSLLKHLNPIFHPPAANLFVLLLFIFLIFFIFTKLRRQLFGLEKKLYIQLLLFTVTSSVGSLYIGFSLIRLGVLWLFIFVLFQSIKRLGNFDVVGFLIRISGVIIYTSVPLLFFEAGHLIGMTLFKGIFNHSQEFALILLPLFMLHFMTLISKKIAVNRFHIFTLAIGFTEIVQSASRSAVFAILAALLIYFILRKVNKYNLRSLAWSFFIMIICIVGYSVNNTEVDKKMRSFFLKYGQSDTISQSVEGRLLLIEISKQNFLNKPFTGVGFNVQTYYPDPRVQMNLDELTKYIPGTSIMYSRPLEKGNLYASVLEEGGLLTGLYFVYLLLSLFWVLYRSGLSCTWVAFVAMIANFNGEASLFSPLGPGNFQLIILVSFYILAIQNRRKLTLNV